MLICQFNTVAVKLTINVTYGNIESNITIYY